MLENSAPHLRTAGPFVVDPTHFLDRPAVGDAQREIEILLPYQHRGSVALARRTMRSTTEGCRPSEISSMSKRRGRNINARARISIFCSPPESVPARCFRRQHRVEAGQTQHVDAGRR